MSEDQSQTTLADHELQDHQQDASIRQKITVAPGSVEQPQRLGPHADVPDEEKLQGDESKGGKESEKHLVVTWDGDYDPMNPRSMGIARKWLIVLIVSTSSLCV